LGRLCVVYAQKAQKLGACGGLKKAERVPGTRLGRWWLFSVQRSLHCMGHDIFSCTSKRNGHGPGHRPVPVMTEAQYQLSSFKKSLKLMRGTWQKKKGGTGFLCTNGEVVGQSGAGGALRLITARTYLLGRMG